MAWNPSPQVAVARDAAKALNAHMVVVLYVKATGDDGAQLGYASYGETKALCGEARKLADVAYDAMMDKLSNVR